MNDCFYKGIAVKGEVLTDMLKTAKFVIDGAGNKIAIQIDIEEYERLLEELEDLEDIRAADAARAEVGEPVPFDQVMAEIRGKRK